MSELRRITKLVDPIGVFSKFLTCTIIHFHHHHHLSQAHVQILRQSYTASVSLRIAVTEAGRFGGQLRSGNIIASKVAVLSRWRRWYDIALVMGEVWPLP